MPEGMAKGMMQRYGPFGVWVACLLDWVMLVIKAFAVEDGARWQAFVDLDSAHLATAIVLLAGPLYPFYQRWWPKPLQTEETEPLAPAGEATQEATLRTRVWVVLLAIFLAIATLGGCKSLWDALQDAVPANPIQTGAVVVPIEPQPMGEDRRED